MVQMYIHVFRLQQNIWLHKTWQTAVEINTYWSSPGNYQIFNEHVFK